VFLSLIGLVELETILAGEEIDFSQNLLQYLIRLLIMKLVNHLFNINVPELGHVVHEGAKIHALHHGSEGDVLLKIKVNPIPNVSVSTKILSESINTIKP
jgi:hypothetical protein